MKSHFIRLEFHIGFFSRYRADDFLTLNGKLYNVFRCIKAAQLTNFSYSYYVMNGMYFKKDP